MPTRVGLTCMRQQPTEVSFNDFKYPDLDLNHVGFEERLENIIQGYPMFYNALRIIDKVAVQFDFSVHYSEDIATLNSSEAK